MSSTVSQWHGACPSVKMATPITIPINSDTLASPRRIRTGSGGSSDGGGSGSCGSGSGTNSPVYFGRTSPGSCVQKVTLTIIVDNTENIYMPLSDSLTLRELFPAAFKCLRDNIWTINSSVSIVRCTQSPIFVVIFSFVLTIAWDIS